MITELQLVQALARMYLKRDGEHPYGELKRLAESHGVSYADLANAVSRERDLARLAQRRPVPEKPRGSRRPRFILSPA